jgi:hypothetical protein
MLASVDPGYSIPAVASLLETHVNNGTLHFTGSQADLPHGVVYSEILNEIFFDTPPVKELRKKFKLVKTGGTKPLIGALLKAWKEFDRARRNPNVAILDFKHPFHSFESTEYLLLAEILRGAGLNVEVVSPEELDYRGGVLRRGDYAINVVYRGIQAHDFLLRYDLTHPLVRAYREGKVCVVNSFRTELTRKRSLFALLSDPEVTASFPAAERHAIAESIPWTRIVGQTKTTRNGRTIDLPEYIQKHRDRLVLRPVDSISELPTVDGKHTDDAGWDRALRQALRNRYVVQDRIEEKPVSFPVELYGEMVYRDLNVEVTPQAFLGRVQSCAARISAANSSFSSISGLAPVFILEGK